MLSQKFSFGMLCFLMYELCSINLLCVMMLQIYLSIFCHQISLNVFRCISISVSHSHTPLYLTTDCETYQSYAKPYNSTKTKPQCLPPLPSGFTPLNACPLNGYLRYLRVCIPPPNMRRFSEPQHFYARA